RRRIFSASGLTKVTPPSASSESTPQAHEVCSKSSKLNPGLPKLETELDIVQSIYNRFTRVGVTSSKLDGLPQRNRQRAATRNKPRNFWRKRGQKVGARHEEGKFLKAEPTGGNCSTKRNCGQR